MYDDNIDYRRPQNHNISFVESENCDECRKNAANEQVKRPLYAHEDIRIVFIGCNAHPTE